MQYVTLMVPQDFYNQLRQQQNETIALQTSDDSSKPNIEDINVTVPQSSKDSEPPMTSSMHEINDLSVDGEESAFDVEASPSNLKEHGSDLEEHASVLNEHSSALKEPASDLKECGTDLEERVTNIEEHATGMEEQATGMEEQATGIEEQATGIEESTSKLEENASASRKYNYQIIDDKMQITCMNCSRSYSTKSNFNRHLKMCEEFKLTKRFTPKRTPVKKKPSDIPESAIKYQNRLKPTIINKLQGEHEKSATWIPVRATTSTKPINVKTVKYFVVKKKTT